MKKENNMERINFIVPEVDKNVHLYLGFRGFKGDYAVLNKIKEYMNEHETGDWFHDNSIESHKGLAERFIDVNKDNYEVMKYLYEE